MKIPGGILKVYLYIKEAKEHTIRFKLNGNHCTKTMSCEVSERKRCRLESKRGSSGAEIFSAEW